jgi:hypothetical protein
MMKISDEEVKAALNALALSDDRVSVSFVEMHTALEAAYRVRKARKAAKRSGTAQGSKHQFAVGDFVLHSQRGHGQITSISTEANFELTPYIVLFTAEFKSYPCSGKHLTFIDGTRSTKLVCADKFEVGKAYRTRDGRKAIIGGLLSGTYRIAGHIGGSRRTWTDNGELLYGQKNAEDLIAPWEEEK